MCKLLLICLTLNTCIQKTTLTFSSSYISQYLHNLFLHIDSLFTFLTLSYIVYIRSHPLLSTHRKRLIYVYRFNSLLSINTHKSYPFFSSLTFYPLFACLSSIHSLSHQLFACLSSMNTQKAVYCIRSLFMYESIYYILYYIYYDKQVQGRTKIYKTSYHFTPIIITTLTQSTVNAFLYLHI